MHHGYSFQVGPHHFDHIASIDETNGKRLDESMRSVYHAHIVVGRNGYNELLFVLHEPSNYDGYKALLEACGVYSCKVGHFPDFLVVQGEVLLLTVTGAASPQCLNFAKFRRMFMLLGHNLDAFCRMLASCRCLDFDALADLLPRARSEPLSHRGNISRSGPRAGQRPAVHSLARDDERQNFVRIGERVETLDRS